jgi:hypothetical protein
MHRHGFETCDDLGNGEWVCHRRRWSPMFVISLPLFVIGFVVSAFYIGLTVYACFEAWEVQKRIDREEAGKPKQQLVAPPQKRDHQ